MEMELRRLDRGGLNLRQCVVGMATEVRRFDRGWLNLRQCVVGMATEVRRFDRGAGQASGVEVSWMAWARVFQERVAHLMRTGNFTTPRSASRSPSLAPGSSVAAMTSVSSSPSPSSDCSWIDILPLKDRG